MTHPDLATRPADPDTTEAQTAPEEQGNPWDGIPPELLYCLGSYDTDSAGGCG
jgi:hypothetical protein